ncbi:MAG: hypothetical protein ACKOC5_10200 [Chloroflexota bacterium]
MAKKPLGIFKRTETAGPADEPKDDPVKAVGVGLRLSEWARMEEIAGSLGINKHKLAAWALRDFLARFAAGEIPVENKPTLPKR